MGETEIKSDPDTSLQDDLEGTVITVDELNEKTSRVIRKARSDELDFDFLIGDVSDDSVSDGTRYFDLVNDEAKITCLAFDDVRTGLPEFEEGDRVAVSGRLNFYEKRGGCSLYIDTVTLLGESHYHGEIERARKQLTEEGAFDDAAKSAVPAYPAKVGLVTASGSDAEADAVNAIHTRNPSVDIVVHDSRVQGMSALRDLCTAIIRLDEDDSVDVIVVTRGGGSEKSLYVFNTVGICRSVSDSTTPIVTAIGHEEDRPLVDDAADARAMTPTDVGDVTVESMSQLLDQISRLRDNLTTEYDRLYTSKLSSIRGRSTDSYRSLITEVTARLSDSLATTHSQLHSSRVPHLTAQVDRSYTSLADEATTTLSDSLVGTYNRRLKKSTAALERRLTTSHSQYTRGSVVSLSNDLERAHDAFQQRKRHEQETEAIQQKHRQYKIAVAGLTGILAVLLVGIVLFVL